MAGDEVFDPCAMYKQEDMPRCGSEKGGRPKACVNAAWRCYREVRKAD